MKRRYIAATALALSIGYFSPKLASAEDISSHWAYTEMNYLINEEIMKGDESGNYRLNDSVNRAEFATFLVRALKLPEVSTPSTFNDVHADAWYYNFINQASYYGLIKGDEKGNFNPNGKINRQEMAAMIKRALDYRGIPSAAISISFNDNAKIASWAYSDVQNVVSLKLMGGQPGNLFAPQASATRAEAGVVLYRLLNSGSGNGNGTGTNIEPVIATTEYPLDFSTVLTTQANHRPNQDGNGKFIASPALVAYYLNANNFSVNSPEYYQFLKLSTPVTGLNADKINQNILFDKLIFQGEANSFIEAGLTYKINQIYLISHALHETNNGKSKLANGIEVGLNSLGKPEMVTDANRANLTNIKVTYNFYGIGAINADPNKYGSERAYSEAWFTVHDAIVGGAKFVREKYIDEGQDTLYKMKWDPDQPTNHQYATHVMWALIQARKIHDFYEASGSDTTTQLVFDVPHYANQPAASPFPAPEAQYAVLPAMQGGVGFINSVDGDVNIRTYPVTGISTNIITKLQHETKISVVGSNGGWYKVVANGTEGWISSEYVKLTNVLQVVDMSEFAVKTLNVRSEPNTTSTTIGKVDHKSLVVGVTDADGKFVKNGEWYQVLVDGKTGWVSGEFVKEIAAK